MTRLAGLRANLNLQRETLHILYHLSCPLTVSLSIIDCETDLPTKLIRLFFIQEHRHHSLRCSFRPTIRSDLSHRKWQQLLSGATVKRTDYIGRRDIGALIATTLHASRKEHSLCREEHSHLRGRDSFSQADPDDRIGTAANTRCLTSCVHRLHQVNVGPVGLASVSSGLQALGQDAIHMLPVSTMNRDFRYIRQRHGLQAKVLIQLPLSPFAVSLGTGQRH